MGNSGKARLKLERGGLDVSAAFDKSQMKNIRPYNKDSIQMTTYSAVCIEINALNSYPQRQSDDVYIPCMPEEEFLLLMAKDFIDESKLSKSRWNINEEGENSAQASK